MPPKKENDNAPRELSISRVVHAPREMVWEAWTNPEHIRHWWGPAGFKNTIHKMEVRPGGVWEFIMHGPDGTDYKNKHIYREVVRPEKLVMEHVTHPLFMMTVTFEAIGNTTLLSIQSVFESAEQLKEVIRVFKADEGMKQNAERMVRYARDPASKLKGGEPSFRIERVFKSPVEKVWQALTDKDQMKQWYFDLAEFRPETGFEFQFYGQGHKGDQYLHLCKVLEAIPYEKLSYTWRYDQLPGNSVLTFELIAEGDSTRLILTHDGLDSFMDNGPDFAKESFTKGWTELIGTSLKDFTEKNGNDYKTA